MQLTVSAIAAMDYVNSENRLSDSSPAFGFFVKCYSDRGDWNVVLGYLLGSIFGPGVGRQDRYVVAVAGSLDLERAEQIPSCWLYGGFGF